MTVVVKMEIIITIVPNKRRVLARRAPRCLSQANVTAKNQKETRRHREVLARAILSRKKVKMMMKKIFFV